MYVILLTLIYWEIKLILLTIVNIFIFTCVGLKRYVYVSVNNVVGHMWTVHIESVYILRYYRFEAGT